MLYFVLTEFAGTWFFNSFKVDIPFLELMSKTVTLNSLSKTIVAEVSKSEE